MKIEDEPALLWRPNYEVQNDINWISKWWNRKVQLHTVVSQGKQMCTKSKESLEANFPKQKQHDCKYIADVYSCHGTFLISPIRYSSNTKRKQFQYTRLYHCCIMYKVLQSFLLIKIVQKMTRNAKQRRERISYLMMTKISQHLCSCCKCFYDCMSTTFKCRGRWPFCFLVTSHCDAVIIIIGWSNVLNPSAYIVNIVWYAA